MSLIVGTGKPKCPKRQMIDSAGVENMPQPLTKVEFTNLDKVMYPELRVTKGQVIEYYIRTSSKMLSLLTGRPVVLTRYPNGIHGESFYEKNAPAGTPAWVETVKIEDEEAQTINYVVCNNLDTLVWLANLAALEVHVNLAKAEQFEKPDLMVFDVDPEPPAGVDEAVATALLVKEKLDSIKLQSYPKTSGKKGIHIFLPIEPGYSYRQTREFVHTIGRYLAKESDIIVSEFSKSRDPGTVYIDYVQNSHGKTMVCPYSLRATPQATVSTPLEWTQVKKGLKPEELNIFTVAKTSHEPWQGILKHKQKLEWT